LISSRGLIVEDGGNVEDAEGRGQSQFVSRRYRWLFECRERDACGWEIDGGGRVDDDDDVRSVASLPGVGWLRWDGMDVRSDTQDAEGVGWMRRVKEEDREIGRGGKGGVEEEGKGRGGNCKR